MVLHNGVDTSWHYIHSHGTRHSVKKHTINYRWCACPILPLLGGGWKYRKGGWRYRNDIFTPGWKYRTIFSPRVENIGGWKYRITPAFPAHAQHVIVTTQLPEIYSKIQFPFNLITSEKLLVKWPLLFYYCTWSAGSTVKSQGRRTCGAHMYIWLNELWIVPFHKDFSPSGEQPEQHNLVHTL